MEEVSKHWKCWVSKVKKNGSFVAEGSVCGWLAPVRIQGLGLLNKYNEIINHF